MRQRDIKLLWGRAAARCSCPECRLKLAQDAARANDSYPLGEQAHIVAEKPDGLRGKSDLTAEERDAYFNRILLCPTHHRMIDTDVVSHSVERLHQMKAQHELWVEESLGREDRGKTAEDAVHAALVDAAVEACRLAEWEAWTSFALATTPVWDAEAPGRLFEFRQKVMAAAWPGSNPEFQKAMQTLSIAAHSAVKVFEEHCEEVADGRLRAFKFYRIREYDEKRYNRLLQQYEEWVGECHRAVFEATKAANWFADVVRRDLNPMFFAEEGKFLVVHGPFGPDLSYRAQLLEYTEEEKAGLPGGLIAIKGAENAE